MPLDSRIVGSIPLPEPYLDQQVKREHIASSQQARKTSEAELEQKHREMLADKALDALGTQFVNPDGSLNVNAAQKAIADAGLGHYLPKMSPLFQASEQSRLQAVRLKQQADEHIDNMFGADAAAVIAGGYKRETALAFLGVRTKQGYIPKDVAVQMTHDLMDGDDEHFHAVIDGLRDKSPIQREQARKDQAEARAAADLERKSAHDQAMEEAASARQTALDTHQRTTEALTQENVRADNVRADKVVDETARHNREMAQAALIRARRPPAAGGTDTKDDAKAIADAIVSGDQPPDTTGLYRFAGPVRAELGKQGYNLTTANLDWQATKKHLQTLNGAQQTRLRQAISTASDSLGVIEDLAKQWDGGKFPIFNKASLAAAKNGALGPQAQQIATNLTAQITDVVSELGNVYMGGNSPTDHALSLAGKNLSADWTRDQLLSAVKLARTNLKIRQNSITNAGAITSTSQEGAKTETPAAAPAASPVGRKVSFQGKEWRVKSVKPNGQFELEPWQP